MTSKPWPMPATSSAGVVNIQQTMIHVANAQAALVALDQARAQLDDAIARVRDHLDKATRL